MNKLAPIALFVYRRRDCTQQTVEALQANILAAESELIIFSDAAKNKNTVNDVQQVRKYIKTISGFLSVTLIEREKNLGLANSIISGVSEIVQRYGKIIVVEDDLVTSKYFLQFMNDGLQKYEQDERVISIHGYCYPVQKKLPETFFLRGADCWGWATWKRAWNIFEPNGEKLLQQIKEKNLQQQFNFNNTYQFTKMLKRQVRNEIDSWAIRWNASAFVQNKLTLYPGVSLVDNIGGSTDATHTFSVKEFRQPVAQVPIQLTDIPIEESTIAKTLYEEYFREIQPSLLNRALMRCRKYFYSLWK